MARQPHSFVHTNEWDDANGPSRYYARMRNLAVLASAFFVVALCAALIGFQVRSEQAVRDGILTQARAHAREFSAVRSYVQGFTGIYVPASKDIRVNPHLQGIKGITPQIDAANGKTYVLQNAPIVARQVSQILENDRSGEVVRMRMYGPEPLNPQNSPTPFALDALKELQTGSKEAASFARTGQADFFRYALGVPANEKCGKCHEALVGVTKGIVGVSVVEMDVTRPLGYITRSRTWTGGVVVAVILASICVMYVFVTRVLKRMHEAQSQIYDMARRDMLTGLASRGVGMAALETEITRARRERRSLACCVIDLDDFKRVNDDLGHDVGDRVLQTVGTAITTHLRTYDIAARVGGEEFLLVLPGTDARDALDISERIRNGITAAASAVDGLDRAITATTGIAVFDPLASEDARAIYIRADHALLTAKQSGKNRVVVAPPASHDSAHEHSVAALGGAQTSDA